MLPVPMYRGHQASTLYTVHRPTPQLSPLVKMMKLAAFATLATVGLSAPVPAVEMDDMIQLACAPTHPQSHTSGEKDEGEKGGACQLFDSCS